MDALPAKPKRSASARWATLALGVVTALALWTSLLRYRDPLGEKFFPIMPPGAGDFVVSYLGARALLMGVNPYANDLPELRDPWKREAVFDGKRSGAFYPPSQLLLFVPLAWTFEADWRAAGRVWLAVNFALLAALAWLTWALLRRVVGEEPGRGVLFFLAFALAMHAGQQMGFERGQTDLFAAVLCWGAVLAAVDDRAGLAIFLAAIATLMKGYAGLVGLGLAVLFLNRRQGWRVVTGAAAAVIVVLAPVARYLPEAARNVSHRAGLVEDTASMNHSFLNLWLGVWPEAASVGSKALSAAAFAAAVLCLLLAWRKIAAGPSGAERAMWLTVFATTALGAVISSPATSYIYNLVLVLPGLLIAASAQEVVAELLKLSRSGEHALGVGVALTVGAVYLVAWPPAQFPIAGLGLVMWIVVVLAVAVCALRPRAG